MATRKIHDISHHIGKKKTIEPKHKGQKAIHFKQGTLHSQLHVPQSQRIPSSKIQAAISGKYGTLAKKRANFAKNVLKGK